MSPVLGERGCHLGDRGEGENPVNRVLKKERNRQTEFLKEVSCSTSSSSCVLLRGFRGGTIFATIFYGAQNIVPLQKKRISPQFDNSPQTTYLQYETKNMGRGLENIKTGEINEKTKQMGHTLSIPIFIR